jgi:EAL domain-containing protein (putative c-di-GMP-specific phosphodiesterase class I)/FixJ family two-component response regulator
MTPPMRVSVLIAEDDEAVRRALASLIESEPGLSLAGVAANADEAIEMACTMSPEVALVDVRMPGGGGARAARELKVLSPRTKVIALSGSDDRSSVLEMLEAGSVGYLVKGGSIQTIVDTIYRVAGGQSSLSAEVTGEVIDALVEQLGDRRRTEDRTRQQRTRVEHVLRDATCLQVVGQPICELDGLSMIGIEALARFRTPPDRSPDLWFAEASEVGLRTQLELAALERALERLPEVPPGVFLFLNASPETLATSAFHTLVAGAAPGRLVIELTEHAPIDDYDLLNLAIGDIRALGVRLAIDDAGAGFASLRHILRLAPDFIKLDGTLVAGIENDRSQQALAAGLISFSEKIGATIIAEGVETRAALTALRGLGVRYGQGYHLGRPVADLHRAPALVTF